MLLVLFFKFGNIFDFSFYYYKLVFTKDLISISLNLKFDYYGNEVIYFCLFFD